MCVSINVCVHVCVWESKDYGNNVYLTMSVNITAGYKSSN